MRHRIRSVTGRVSVCFWYCVLVLSLGKEKKNKPKTLLANSGNFLLIHDKKRGEREHRLNSPICDIEGENSDRVISTVYVFKGSLTTHEISRKFKIKQSG